MKPLPESFYKSDRRERANTKDEMLLLIVMHPGVDPYRMTGGCVRMVAVDRWLTELQRDEMIDGRETTDGAVCWPLPKGKRYAAWLRKEFKRP